MINPGYSFQIVRDPRTAISLGVSGGAAVAILVSLVALTYFQYLPDYCYYIAGGGFVSSLLIGALSATLREQVINIAALAAMFRDPVINTTSESMSSAIADGNPVSRKPLFTIDINPIAVLPPDQHWPLVSATYQFETEGVKTEMRVSEFFQEDGKLYAYVIGENPKVGLKRICVDKEVGWNNDDRDHQTMMPNKEIGHATKWSMGEKGFQWGVDAAQEQITLTLKRTKRSLWLNERMKLGNNLRMIDASELYTRIGSKTTAYYFYTGFGLPNRGQFELAIPGVVNYEIVDNRLVRFKVNAEIYEQHREQIELLKQLQGSVSNWATTLVEVAKQLESPVWEYDCGPCNDIKVDINAETKKVTITITREKDLYELD